MVYEPLHHKYRPQTFGQLVGQEAIARTLSQALEWQRIAPAYLFTGPRGTGKTSSARILAKSLNCQRDGKPTPQPCGTCDICRSITRGAALDVIEIDAASNTGVDNIREIIERAQFAPVQCRYKVYVIDECHMLSTAAFNALLKTLEEPPPHVVFVLATTDPQRVLPTIISRCQRFDYRRIPLDAMVNHLNFIAQEEAIAITPEALTLVAQIANGGLRDAESLLDQLGLLTGPVTPEQVWDLVGAVPERDLLSLLQSLRLSVGEAILDQCRHLLNRGREPLVVLQSLAGFFVNLLIAKNAPDRPDLVSVTAPTWEALKAESQYWQDGAILRAQQRLKSSEVQLKNSTQPRLWLEVILLTLRQEDISASPPTLPSGIITNGNGQGNGRKIERNGAEKILSPEPETPSMPSAPLMPPLPVHTDPPSVVVSDPPPAPPPPDEVAMDGEQFWGDLLGQIAPRTTQELLRQHTQLRELRGSGLHLSVTPNLLKIIQPKQGEIEKVARSLLGKAVTVHFHPRGEEKKTTSNPLPHVPIAPPPPMVRSPEPPTPTPQGERVTATALPIPTPQVVVLPPAPEVAVAIAPDPSDPEAWSAPQLRRLAEQLAESFKGEVVTPDEALGEEEEGEGDRAIAPPPVVLGMAPVPAVGANPGPHQAVPPSPPVPNPGQRITGRPSLPDGLDPEELPF